MRVGRAEAEKLAVRLAGAHHGRRLYGSKGSGWQRTLEALTDLLNGMLDATESGELTVALLASGVAVAGVPLIEPPSAVVRFLGKLAERDVEIISFRRGLSAAEVEVLLTFLSVDAAEVAAMKAELWLAERGVQHIGIKHLALMRGAGVDAFREVYAKGKKVLARELDRAAAKGTVHAGAVNELSRALLEVVQASETPIATLLALRDRGDFQMVHSVNVATLVGCQAGALELPEIEVQAMVAAALVHDLGKTKVPEAILANRGHLSSNEQQLLARHTVEGARILFETGGLPLAAVVAEQHHRISKHDAPQLLAVELCRLADCFDGLRSLRPFDDAAGARGALAFMVRRLRARFNPYLLERFAKLMGVNPAKERVFLSSGELVEVLEPHPELGFRPKVRVLDRRKGTLAPGVELDLAQNTDPSAPLAAPGLLPDWLELTAAQLDDLG